MKYENSKRDWSFDWCRSSALFGFHRRIDEQNEPEKKKGFFVLFKGADIKRLSIHWVSQSYYYFAIILTLIPFREPVSQPQHRRFTIHEVTLWWIWTIQPGRTRIQEKKTRLIILWKIWLFMILVDRICFDYLFLISVTAHCVLMTSWKRWEQKYFFQKTQEK